MLLSYRLQNSRFFFSKSVKKSVKRALRILHARSARALHARRACEAREKKPTVRFPYNEFVPTIYAYIYTHPRNLGGDKIVRPPLPPYVYHMLSKKEVLFKVFILRGFKRVYYRSKPTISCTDSTWI